MEGSELKAAIEALIFTSEQPVTRAMFQQALPDVEAGTVKSVLAELTEDYARPERGVELAEVAGGWIFRTKPEYAAVVNALQAARPTKLSRAALETLAIVAYRQPVTRGGVEDIRGVDSGGVLKTLLEKRLVRILGRSEAVGNPLLYGTTRDFLEVFGLKNLTDLPTLREFQELDEDSRKLLPEEPEPTEDIGSTEDEGATAGEVESELLPNEDNPEPTYESPSEDRE